LFSLLDRYLENSDVSARLSLGLEERDEEGGGKGTMPSVAKPAKCSKNVFLISAHEKNLGNMQLDAKATI
jgi:hypothetical protein